MMNKKGGSKYNRLHVLSTLRWRYLLCLSQTTSYHVHICQQSDYWSWQLDFQSRDIQLSEDTYFESSRGSFISCQICINLDLSQHSLEESELTAALIVSWMHSRAQKPTARSGFSLEYIQFQFVLPKDTWSIGHMSHGTILWSFFIFF